MIGVFGSLAAARAAGRCAEQQERIAHAEMARYWFELCQREHLGKQYKCGPWTWYYAPPFTKIIDN